MAEKSKKPAPKSITANEFYTALAEESNLTKAEVKALYEALSAVIVKQLTKKGGGLLKLPNMFKLTLKKRDAVKGGDMFFNPLTKKEEVRKPKPAKKYISVRVLKPLNESLEK